MAAKPQKATWLCPQCNSSNYTMEYDKRKNESVVKVLSKFCSQCRAHLDHKRKDIKKAAK